MTDPMHPHAARFQNTDRRRKPRFDKTVLASIVQATGAAANRTCAAA
jgi:hypothetical protein